MKAELRTTYERLSKSNWQTWPLSEQEKLQKNLLELERACCAEDFHTFIEIAWSKIYPDKFVDNWHIGALAEHLEAVVARDIRWLLINVPPRTGKSSLINVMLPAWRWAQEPKERWLFTTYSELLTERDSIRCRDLMKTDWYRRRWGDRFALTTEQTLKLENDKGGYRISTSVDGRGTGEGGDIIVADDPHNANEIHSPTIRENVLRWWDDTMSTRGNNPQTDCRVIVMQRLHQQDLSSHVINQGGYVHLKLPMEFEPKSRSITLPLKSTGKKKWHDPRRKEGELLWPARFGTEEVKRLKRSMSSYAYAGQMQQRPAPAEGGIIKKPWWRMYPDSLKVKPRNPLAMPQCAAVIQAWDMGNKDTVTSDYSACTTWGVFWENFGDVDQEMIELGAMNEMGRWAILLLNAWRAKDPYFKVRRKALELHERWKPDIIIIEEKQAGATLVQDLRRAALPVKTYVQKRGDTKEARCHAVSHYWENGLVFAPNTRFAADVIEEMGFFPNGENDDYCDTCFMAVDYFAKGQYVRHSDDPDLHDDDDFDDPHNYDVSQASRIYRDILGR